MKKIYDPSQFEEKWIAIWNSNNNFNPDSTDYKKNFSLVIPPPNVTGSLHLGHALVNTIQDIIVRFKRMSHYNTLWLPGLDHAGIATQMMVKKHLSSQGLDRENLTKDQFIKHVWDWKEKQQQNIISQLKRLGCSLDWSRLKFTLDADLSNAVSEAFIRLFNEGSIYKGERLVNWCPVDKTALSDLEVDHYEVDGFIYHIAYQVVGLEPIVIATTRPETIFGDVAVAVNPQDPRFKKYIGKKAIVPLINREVPIIEDIAVKLDFGTGALKITPAHDFIDFEIGTRHSLPSINIFDEQARLNDIYPPLQGVDRFEARKIVEEKLSQEKKLIAKKAHKQVIGHSQRQKSIVEPRLSIQWFFDVKPIANQILPKLESGEIKIFPQTQQAVLKHWLNTIEPWCISRQLWWGHKIPAYYCYGCKKDYAAKYQEQSQCLKCASKNIKWEEDVLDTWFSSGLFPFSTLGWPNEKSADYTNYYPNSTLVTAYDILFFWVARMLIMGLSLTGKLPFSEVYAHGLIRDEQGKKMSKTAGNSIDPLQIIGEHGADSLRLTLCANTNLGQDIKLSMKNVINSKAFINKLFNAGNFIQYQNELAAYKFDPNENINLENIFSLLMLNNLSNAGVLLEDAINKYRFHEVYDILFNVFWRQFCDNYIEISKELVKDVRAKKEILYVLNLAYKQLLSFMHPVIPFITEELNAEIYSDSKLLALSSFVIVDKKYLSSNVAEATIVYEAIELVRSLKGEQNIHPATKLEAAILPLNEAAKKSILNSKDLIMKLVHLNLLQLEEFANDNKSITKSNNNLIVQLKIPQTQASNEKLKKELDKLISRKNLLQSKLVNQGFIAKASAAVVESTKTELAELDKQIKSLQD